MTVYNAPLRDIHFVRDELLGLSDYYQSVPDWQEVTSDLTTAVLDECAKFCENVLAPLNRVGDIESCQLHDGVVTTPTGFKEAYQQYIGDGWTSLDAPEEYGGQGLPYSLGLAVTEMTGTANWSWQMYPGLSKGAINTVLTHGSDEQKRLYLTNLVEGTWTGTMCLTEGHSGSDLGLLRCKAEPNADGSYSISGTKIFVSSGEHDLSENIVHIVLARLPDAPAGTRGISLFIVPKFCVNDDGSIGERNAVLCGSLEHKMGIHGNATCVMNFDGAKGYLVGAPNHGLHCMFTFMNTARIGIAIQGLSHAELAYQNALKYAKERLQMRALSGAKLPEKPADPIIVHPDVRRMLLTQKAFAEGARMLIYWTSSYLDTMSATTSDTEREEADKLLGLLTPIAKAFITETGMEAANLGMQCFGGHGYISESGMEQNVRDAHIATLYEGTTGIQAMDLLGRKVLQDQGESLQLLAKIAGQFCVEQSNNEAMKEFVEPLESLMKEWGGITMQIGKAAFGNPDEINAACVDYLMYAGYVIYAYLWARAALVAQTALSSEPSDEGFYTAKVQTARFFYQRILPRTRCLVETMMAGVDGLENPGWDDLDLQYA
jgi:alkylation response protein AidB-like acyl-CoA dehydrogenase